MLGDILILNAAAILSFTIHTDWNYFFVNSTLQISALLLFSLLTIFLFNFYGLYNTANRRLNDIISAVFISLVLLSLGVAVISYIIPSYIFPRRVLFSFVLMYGFAVTLWRWVLLLIERRIIPKKKVIIVADFQKAIVLQKKLNGDHDFLGVIAEQKQHQGYLPILGEYGEAKRIFAKYRPDVVLLSGCVSEGIKSKIVLYCLEYSCNLYVVPNLYEIMIAQASLDQLQDTPVFQIRLSGNSVKEQAKRVLDCIVAVAILFVTLPISLLSIIAIKLTSSGPVFYVQERIGRHNKPFMLYKFRTMVNNAESATGPVLSSKNDARVTKVGRFLRATRIDELPQLINVLKGDMSIVGPRPERPVFVEQFNEKVPGYSYRHVINTGITGLAQISGRYSTSPEDKLRYDLLYAKEASPLLDVQIMMQTLKVILMRDKAS